MRRALIMAALLGMVATTQAQNMPPMSMPTGTGMKMASKIHGASSGLSSMSSQMQGMLASLRPLKGKAFDIKWTELMMNHHQMAVDMAQRELSMGQDLRVKAAAQKVLDSQMPEIATMQGWLQTWTGKLYTPKSMPMQMNMGGSADRQFLQGMIPHHQGAVDMSRLIPTRTRSPQLRQLGTQIIRAQMAEIVQYRQLLRAVK